MQITKATRAENRLLKKENIKLLKAQEDHLLRIDNLEHMLKNLERVVFGSKSEKSPPHKNENQLELFPTHINDSTDEDLDAICEGDLDLSTDDEDQSSELKTEPVNKKQKKRRQNHIVLEQEVITLEVPEESKHNASGQELHVIGYEESKSLEFVSAKVIELIVKRPIMGDKNTRERDSVTPYKRIIPKGRLGDSLIHKIIHDKFIMALPLDRQLKELHRLGVKLSSSLLSDVVKRFGSFYTDIYNSMRKEALTGLFVHADESPLDYAITTQDAETKKVTKEYKKGTFWVFSNGETCFYHFGTTKSFLELKSIFEKVKENEAPPDGSSSEKITFVRHLMTDGASVYNKVDELELNIVSMACWVHGRRGFEKILKNGEHIGARLIFDQINKLYATENEITAQIQKQHLSYDQGIDLRTKIRGIVSRSIIKKIWQLAERLLLTAQKSSPFEIALNYILKRKEKYEVFLDNGALPIDNNEAENKIRGMVIGRKNYLFVGSEELGLCAAKSYSLVQSCRNAGINFQEYLRYTTKAIHTGRVDFENLTPKALKDIIKKDLAL